MKTIVIELKSDEYQRLNKLKLANKLTWREMLIEGCPKKE